MQQAPKVKLPGWLAHLVATLGGVGLFVVAFLDSSVLSFPIVTDLLVMGESIQNPRRMPYYAAMATVGRGRVVVFGDTSPFQGGLSYAYPRTVGPILDLLSRPAGPLERPPARVLAALVLILALGVLASPRFGDRATVAVSLGLLAGVAGR